MSIAEQDVDDETEQHDSIAIGARGLELPEALLKTGAEVKASKKGLKQDQSGERGELLVFEDGVEGEPWLYVEPVFC